MDSENSPDEQKNMILSEIEDSLQKNTSQSGKPAIKASNVRSLLHEIL